MKIQDFGTLQMVRTDKAHFGQGKIQPLTTNVPGMSPIEKIHNKFQFNMYMIVFFYHKN